MRGNYTVFTVLDVTIGGRERLVVVRVTIQGSQPCTSARDATRSLLYIPPERSLTPGVSLLFDRDDARECSAVVQPGTLFRYAKHSKISKKTHVLAVKYTYVITAKTGDVRSTSPRASKSMLKVRVCVAAGMNT